MGGGGVNMSCGCALLFCVHAAEMWNTQWGTCLRTGEIKMDRWVKKLIKWTDQRKGCSLRPQKRDVHWWAQCWLLETLITRLSHIPFMQPVAQTSTVGVPQWKKSHFGWAEGVTCIYPIMKSKFDDENKLLYKRRCVVSQRISWKLKTRGQCRCAAGCCLFSRGSNGHRFQIAVSKRRELRKMTSFGFSVWTSLVNYAGDLGSWDYLVWLT